jgi:hypothetical protein
MSGTNIELGRRRRYGAHPECVHAAALPIPCHYRSEVNSGKTKHSGCSTTFETHCEGAEKNT